MSPFLISAAPPEHVPNGVAECDELTPIAGCNVTAIKLSTGIDKQRRNQFREGYVRTGVQALFNKKMPKRIDFYCTVYGKICVVCEALKNAFVRGRRIKK